ncbi:hypothetical protein ACCO45_011878 [Purpureocillium lilacinum]|uniref:Uncharacterized protein n=1 Tax=Purpureocillium lilacinum TaxID=33203 RepID=A0ACC4DCN7_PURLI
MEQASVPSSVPEAQKPHCLALLLELGDRQVSFEGFETYSSSLNSYFSQQESELRPACIVAPKTPEDVANAVRVLSGDKKTLADDGSDGGVWGGADFAIRSGGHAAHAGAANIGSTGVTIDLRGLNSIELSADKKTVSVGPGAKWGEVYGKLDELNLCVAGAGPLPLVSAAFLQEEVSLNYQVVLADGSIVNANESENPELLQVLRGGSNNFGIVTRIDLRTFEQGKLWGGVLYHAVDTIDAQLKAFEAFNSADKYDEYASLITSFGYAAGRGSGIVNNLEYTKPVERPPVFEEFMKIPAVMNTMRISNMSDISKEQGSFSTNGLRQLCLQITHGTTLPMLNATFKRWQESVPAIENVTNVVWSLSLEPLPPAIYKKGASLNSLGLADRSKALVVTLLTAMWTDKADDGKIEAAARKMFQDIEADARSLDEYDPFVYLNYAAAWQDPIASYGEKV